MTGGETTPGARKLATVETITELAPIPGADSIERARIRGWDVVVRKDGFSVGDMCVYFEIDSLLDVEDPRFEFLAVRGVRTDAAGNKGHVLRTAKLRGQYSQGLAVRLAAFPELAGAQPGEDVTAALGVIKWDPPIPASLAGQVRGVRPGWIPMTDEGRIQNLPAEILTVEAVWVATEKIDGSSMTAYVDPDADIRGVCSRNLDLLPAESNTLWKLADKGQLHARLESTFPLHKVALQGEAYGEGIQGNPLKMKGQHFAAFALYVDGREVPRGDWPDWILDMSVPVRRDLTYPTTLEQALADVDGLRSALSDRPAEGIVWRAADVARVALADGEQLRASWKVISNRYLLKNDR